MTVSEPCQAIATPTLNPVVDVAYDIPHLIPDWKSHGGAVASSRRFSGGRNHRLCEGRGTANARKPDFLQAGVREEGCKRGD